MELKTKDKIDFLWLYPSPRDWTRHASHGTRRFGCTFGEKENEGDGNGGREKKGEDGARREKGRENGTVIKWSPRLWKGPLAEWRQGWCYDCWQGRGHDCLRQRNPSYFRYQGHKTKANRPSTAPFKDISSEGILFERTAHVFVEIE